MDDGEELFPALLDALAPVGLAYLHVVYADPAEPLWGELRRRWRGTLIANPVLGRGDTLPVDGGRSKADRLLEAGADLISLGRPFLANPDLVERLRLGAPMNPLRPGYLAYGGDEENYLDYPTLEAAKI